MLPPDDQDLEREIALLERWAGRLDLDALTCHTVPWPNLLLFDQLDRAGATDAERIEVARAAAEVHGRRRAIEEADAAAGDELLAVAAAHVRVRGRGVRQVLRRERSRAEALQLAAVRLRPAKARGA